MEKGEEEKGRRGDRKLRIGAREKRRKGESDAMERWTNRLYC
jgi:hypothetical protein